MFGSLIRNYEHGASALILVQFVASVEDKVACPVFLIRFQSIY